MEWIWVLALIVLAAVIGFTVKARKKQNKKQSGPAPAGSAPAAASQGRKDQPSVSPCPVRPPRPAMPAAAQEKADQQASGFSPSRPYSYTVPPAPQVRKDQNTGSFRPISPEKRPAIAAREDMNYSFSSAGPGGNMSVSAAAKQENNARTDRIRFSALTGRAADRGDYLLIDLYAYEDACRHLVDEAMKNAGEEMQEKQSGYQNVREGQRISVTLVSRDIGYEDMSEMEWAGGFLDFSFAAEIPEDCAKSRILFTASVSMDGIPVTKLFFTVDVRGEKAPAEIERHDIRSAFISYASSDRETVTMLIMGMKRVNPEMDLFFDVENISSGSYWETVLKKEILDRDVLFLCWSRNASASEWVEKEWRYAYEQKGIDAIEPLPLEPPENCPPPPELQQKHFNNILLYVTARRTAEQHREDEVPHIKDMMTGTDYPLNNGDLLIGRGEDCRVVVRGDVTVSRNHCSVRCEGNEIILRCMGRNGVLLFRDQELHMAGPNETFRLNRSCYLRVGRNALFRISAGRDKNDSRPFCETVSECRT